MVNIGMVAGEASGDMLAGLLLGGLNAQGVDHQSVGIGGPLMAASGFTPWWSYHELAVRLRRGPASLSTNCGHSTAIGRPLDGA